MNTFYKTFIIIFTLWMNACTTHPQDSWQLSSISGDLRIDLTLEQQQLFYTVSHKGKNGFDEVIQKSPMGITRADVDFTHGLSFLEASEVQTIDEQYQVVTGKATKLCYHASEMKVSFYASSGQHLDIAMRAYDDGIAFRYVFPETMDGEFLVTGELTGFNLPEGKAWIQPYDNITKWTPAYERYYENEINIGDPSPQPNGWCFPALFHTADTWILLSEAGLDGDFYGAHLNPDAPAGLYTIRQPEESEAIGVYKQEAHAQKLPWASPWRVAIIGSNLQTIIASNMVQHLSPPNRVNDISWIKPGRASWSWLSDHDSPKDFSKLKDFVDLAAEMGWEYSLVDANWNMMEGGDIEELVDYANSKDVEILLWYNSGGPHNEVGENVRDKMHVATGRRAEFARLQELGVKGVKIDFFQSDKPGMMKLYKDILEDAADFKIMVNLHGCTIPRGWSRTYPHLMSMESVRGAECYTFASEYPDYAPANNTVLPVTRNVIGSMDYTPVLFSDTQYPHITSFGHELALPILFESGWLHLADAAESFRALPDAPKQYLQEIPVVWDETKYVAGWPGKDMVLARRKGDCWYVAGINGEGIKKILDIELCFLPNGKFQAELITDGETKRDFSNSNVEVASEMPLKLPLLPHGGFVLKIKI